MMISSCAQSTCGCLKYSNGMRIFRSINALPETARSNSIAIGNFDGVHSGHRAVLDEAVKHARHHGVPASVMTFEPHPRRVLRPELPPMKLLPAREKIHLLAQYGIEHVFMLRFTREFAALTADMFIRDLVVRQLAATHVTTGDNFTFGSSRSGNSALLMQSAANYGFKYHAVPAVKMGGGVCSSTRIRELLSLAKLREAGILLGRPYEISGKVKHGDGRGRVIGFPTANVNTHSLFLPLYGVYAVWCTMEDGNGWLPGVANIGMRPTLPAVTPSLEVHVLNTTGDIYGRRMRVRPVHYLRGEQKFSGLSELQAQIALDCAHARRVLEPRAF